MISIAYPKSEPNAVYDVGSEALIGVLRQAPIPFLPMEWRVNFLHPRWEPHRHGGAACIQSMPWLLNHLGLSDFLRENVAPPFTTGEIRLLSRSHSMRMETVFFVLHASGVMRMLSDI